MKTIAFAVVLIAGMGAPAAAWDGQAIVQDTLLTPVSRTAIDAGSLYLTDFADEPKITAGNTEAELTLIGSYWRDWDGDGAKDTADLFALKGVFVPLCGGDIRYLAVYRNTSGIGLSAFTGGNPPRDINSPGLCATFTYR